MDVGLGLFFQSPTFLEESGEGSVGAVDAEAFRRELALADMAEPLGFDSLWSVEHHFSGLTMMPDLVQFLAYMAGRTRRIQLGTMVVVLPWHVKPVRVAESIAMLDILCDGRLIFGIGRGLGKIEFDGMGVPMGESRGRFIESAEIILTGLERGWVEYDGEFFHQEKRWLRPAPIASFKGRTFAAAVSPESSEIMAKLGLGIMVLPQKPWDTTKADLAHYQETFRQVNGVDAPPTKMLCPVFVDEDEGRAREMGLHYIGKYYHNVLKHYDLAGTHFAGVAGYEHYARGATEMQRRGEDNAAEFYAGLQIYGTPDQCVEKIAERKEILGSDTFIGTFSYAGIEWDDAKRNVDLFMDKVQPRVKAM